MTLSPLAIYDLTVSYGQNDLALDHVSWSVPEGQISAIIGPNGAGKSTLLKAALDLIPVQKGTVKFAGNKHQDVAYMAQLNDIDLDFPITVREVVKMGLYGKLNWWQRLKNADNAAVTQALEQVEMLDYASRQIGQLSGGQRRRVFLARCLVQDADLILMDEPFAGVDVKAQDIILKTLKSLKNKGKTLVIVHHDLNTVAQIFDHVLILNKEVIAHGTPKKTMTKAILQRTYGGAIIV